MCNTCGNANCKGCGRCTTSKIAKILIVVGAINWGIVGVGMLWAKDCNVVGMLLDAGLLAAIVYGLVGVAGIMSIWGCKCKTCTACQAGPANMNKM